MSEELKPLETYGGNCEFHGTDQEACYSYSGAPCCSPVATHPAPAEQVEVVAWLLVKPNGKLAMDAVRHEPGYPAVAVMTVAQHNRIMASAVPAGCKVVEVELLERLAAPHPGDRGWQTWHTQQMIEASKELRAILEAKDE